MKDDQSLCPIDRVFTQTDADRTDDLGFLDRAKTPRLLQFDAILAEPLAWIVAPPWLGKSTVAENAYAWINTRPSALNPATHRCALTRLGTTTADRETPPEWWGEWVCETDPQPAFWLIDGADEGLDRNQHLFHIILGAIDQASPRHLQMLHLILFSRPHGELGDFRGQLQARFAAINHHPQNYWLARLDREAAARLVSESCFPSVVESIRRNDLKSVAGYPVALRYLAKYSETAHLGVPQVWRGILTALLGEAQSNPRVRFNTSPDERFAAACQIASVLALTGRETIREYSPDPAELTTIRLFQHPDNRLQMAARDACQTPAFVHLPEQGAYRFAQRNVQDWFCAFALEQLPLSSFRSVVAGPEGTLIHRLRETARLIWAITTCSEKRAEIDRLSGGVTLPSDAFEPTLAEACRCLDQLETLAGAAPWGLRSGYYREEDLGRLRVEGLGVVLAQRLRDPKRSPQAKRLLIDVAEATTPLDAVDAIVDLVPDASQYEELRYDAVYFVARHGGETHLRELETAIGEADGAAEIDSRLGGVLILELLTRGLWELWRAALHAPRQNADLLDARTMLLHTIAERITLEDARQLLPHLRTLYDRHKDVDGPTSERLPSFLQKTIALVASAVPLAPGDIDALVRFALGLIDDAADNWPVVRKIAISLRGDPTARRCFYEHDIEMIRSGKDERRIAAHGLLLPDDWQWLRDQALGRWTDGQQVWRDSYGVTRQARDRGLLNDDAWSSFVSLVEQHSPGLSAQAEQSIRDYEREEQQLKAKQRAREERNPAPPSLDERIQRILGQTKLGTADQMRRLGFLFADYGSGRGVRGAPELAELPDELWQRVLGTFRAGLDTGHPTPIPASGEFNGLIWGEGTAFFEAACALHELGWLTEELITRWLPTALHIRIGGEWTALIRTCWTVSQTATEAVLLETIPNQIRLREHPFALRDIPSECWTEAMTDLVVKAIRNDAAVPPARRELLEQLVERDAPRVEVIADDWANRPIAANDLDQLRQAGRNVLLVRKPAEALDLIEPDFTDRGVVALEELSALSGHARALQAQWHQWPVNLLERLARLLLTAYPPAKDPKHEAGFVTPQMRLRQLRDQLVDVLLNNDDSECRLAVDRLAAMDENVRNWVVTHRSSAKAGSLLRDVNLTAAKDGATLTVMEAVRILDRTGYRLIRSVDDLFDAVMDGLRDIGRDVGHDLPMLYNAPARGSKNAASTTTKQQPRKHLEEDALQVYLRRRLLERLPRITDGVQIFVGREDVVGVRQRLDLRVTAPCHGSRVLAQVVIEVKWSTNNETRTGLVEQLGQRYLLGEQLTHGIFLVGWSGEWRPGDGTGANPDVDTLVSYLTRQRDDYCRSGQAGAGLRIEPVILDVRWHQTPGA
jgi:hypothetical protein